MARLSMAITLMFVLMFYTSNLTAQTKIGYVNLQQALVSVEEGKKARKQLENIVKKKQRDFDQMQKDLKNLKDELEQQGALMKEELKKQKVQEYQKRLMEIQEYYLNEQKDLAKEEAELTKPILEKMEKILQKFGKKNGYKYIFEKAAVIYAEPGDDLTDQLIKLYNSEK